VRCPIVATIHPPNHLRLKCGYWGGAKEMRPTGINNGITPECHCAFSEVRLNHFKAEPLRHNVSVPYDVTAGDVLFVGNHGLRRPEEACVSPVHRDAVVASDRYEIDRASCLLRMCLKRRTSP